MKKKTIRSGLINIYIYRELLYALIQRNIRSKYIGTFLGLTWLIVFPILMLSIYTFVFGGIFNSRWSPNGDIKEFIIMLFCGLQVHTFLSDTLSQSSSCIAKNPHYVKKIVFPIELIPLSVIGASLINLTVSSMLIIIFQFFDKSLPPTFVLSPIAILPLLILTCGLSWVFALIGLYIKDLNQIVGIFMSILLFLSPIFYPINSVPIAAQKIIKINPITFPIEQVRNVMIRGELIDFKVWFFYTFASLFVFLFGLLLFQKSRNYFSDII